MEVAIIALIVGVSVAALPCWLVIRFWTQSGKMGINVKEVVCPECGCEFPKVRKPVNIRQFLWGGWTCRNCGTETDKYGSIVH
jgi:hypothetical protein